MHPQAKECRRLPEAQGGSWANTRQSITMTGWYDVISLTGGMRSGLSGPHSLHMCRGQPDVLVCLRKGTSDPQMRVEI